MELSLPIYVEVRRDDGQPIHHCRPLFFDGPQGADAHLGLAMSKLNKRLKQFLDKLGAMRRHDALASLAFAPSLDTHVLKLTLNLRERQARCKLLFVVFSALDRRIAFTPSLPELWFELAPTDHLLDRATDVVTRHFRELEKAQRHLGSDARPESISLSGQAWVATIDVRVQTRQPSQKKLERTLAALFDDTKLDGDYELQRVGRCLDWLYPDELERAVARGREVAQLARLLELPDNRPLALVGPRLAGKTTVLHECVRKRVARRGKAYGTKQNVWLLAPQRLIAGMMYVGQWESRVQAILRVARRRRHVLYFDDFLGLYHAGISRDASLSVADVLKPFILRRDVRVLAEMTPEAWQKFQELDRGLADQFHVLRIAATSEEETRRIMLQVHRQLEAQHRSSFDLEALPTIVDLQRSYVRDAAFPGKAAAFSRRLAQKYAKQAITRNEVLQEFHHQTGLSLALLDDRQKIERDAVLKDLRTRIVGQTEAVEAAADVVTVAKARLAAPDRPLATFLFLGPTGVGKTQCAKALAEVMFTDPARLLRFDMNEYGSPHAVAQLVGTLGEPDGLLTAAVRRQPFSVVLLDEIEKAHPDVFDLLLQATGEGRLTDALGRTADFSNAVIVMTSNLGTTAGNVQIGLSSEQHSRRHAYVKAAEDFFRPEFFNRIDRIIPFESLSRDQMRDIAELLLADVFKRDGLVRRRCALSVEPEAMEHIVDAGYHPQFGARALKRAIERQLVQPVAAGLAGVKPELPAVIQVLPQRDGVVACVHPLESVPPVPHHGIGELTALEQLGCARRFVERLEMEMESLRPAQAIRSRGISREQLQYYALQEQLRRVRELVEVFAEAVEASRHNPHAPQIAPRTAVYEKRLQGMARRGLSGRRVLRDIHSAQDIHEYLREAVAAIPRPEQLHQQFAALQQEAAVTHVMQTAIGTPEQALLVIRPLSVAASTFAEQLLILIEVFGKEMSFDCQQYLDNSRRMPRLALRLGGPGIWPLAMAEAGLHVFCLRHENLLPVDVSVFPMQDGDARRQIDAQFDRRIQWLTDLAAGRAAAADDPWPLGPLVRFYDVGGPTLDLRTGISLPSFPSVQEWKTLLLAGLPLPPELEV